MTDHARVDAAALSSSRDRHRRREVRPGWIMWTIGCGLAEVVGMVVAASAFMLSTSLLGEPRTWLAAIVGMLIVVVGGVVEGAAVGLTQWWLLQPWLTALRIRPWVGATVAVAAAGWLLGSAPSMVLAVISGTQASEPSTAQPPQLVMVLGGAALGAVLGAAFGAAQAFVLRSVVRNAAIWVYANALGWTCAMALMFVGASAPDASWSAPSILLTAALTGVVAGMSVGAVTGAFLPRLEPVAADVISG